MSATHPATLQGPTVRDGESEPSCHYCRYFTGHTSWCPVARAEREDSRSERPARRVNLLTTTRERVQRDVIGSTILVTLHGDVHPYTARQVVGTVERVEGARTVVRFRDGRWSYGPSGRVTVR